MRDGGLERTRATRAGEDEGAAGGGGGGEGGEQGGEQGTGNVIGDF
jgi:hypothetical protein